MTLGRSFARLSVPAGGNRVLDRTKGGGYWLVGLIGGEIAAGGVCYLALVGQRIGASNTPKASEIRLSSAKRWDLTNIGGASSERALLATVAAALPARAADAALTYIYSGSGRVLKTPRRRVVRRGTQLMFTAA